MTRCSSRSYTTIPTLALFNTSPKMVNDLGGEFSRAEAFSGQKESVRPRLLSSLIELQKQISIYGNRLGALRAKLPPAELQSK